LKVIQEEKTIKEIFKELWLKYGDYNKCIEELRKIGINASLKYLISLRCRLNLPEMREIILSRKCFYCGKNAEKITYKYSTISEPIAICEKCYNKLHSKEMYKKHRIKILRRQISRMKHIKIYIEPITCPICNRYGYLYAGYNKWIPTGHLVGPFFVVAHITYYKNKQISFICNIGKDENFIEKYSQYLPLCNCKKCRLKRGEINGSNTERENNRRDI
jgi:hypothetical protein